MMLTRPKPLFIFLDLDGVFKTGRSILAQMRFDPVLSKLMNDICRLPDTLVIISATCRLNFKVKEDCEDFWRDLGMPDLKLHDDWYTTRHSDTRVLEIQEWILRNHTEHSDVEYLFVDDEFPAYAAGLEQWVADRLRLDWLVISGNNNGATYRQLRSLRDMYDDRKEAYEKTGWTEEASEGTGSLARRQVAESNRRLGANAAQLAEIRNNVGPANPSISADAQLGFQEFHERSPHFISVRQHVALCQDEGCFICTARFDPRAIVSTVKPSAVRERGTSKEAHEEAEKATKGYDGS